MKRKKVQLLLAAAVLSTVCIFSSAAPAAEADVAAGAVNGDTDTVTAAG